jgi:hypothetical protein
LRSGTLGGTFSSSFVPQGTTGVITKVDGGFLSSDLYAVVFTIERTFFDDSEVTMNRLSSDDIARA